MTQAFCTDCGQPTTARIPAGDDRPRQVCDGCATVHYSNPKVVCGCVLRCEGRLLLARRSIEPRRGFWTIAAGFMENGETTLEAALREAREEVLAEVDNAMIYGVISLPRISQVYVIYRGEVRPGAFGVGDESAEVRLFSADELPWEELAFPAVELTLRRYLADAARGRFEVFESTVHRRPGQRAEAERPAAPVATGGD